MKILVACEQSGTVREAFKKLGHDVWSCDILPTDIPGQHFRCDVLEVLDQNWDMMIAHPPCTYLSNAGLHMCRNNSERTRKRLTAVTFIERLWNSPIARICIENPPGWLNSNWRRPSQIIRVNHFGHSDAKKPTSLWLKGLPLLRPTDKVPAKMREWGKGKIVSEWFYRNRSAKSRSKTFQGVADAMADQWGGLV